MNAMKKMMVAGFVAGVLTNGSLMAAEKAAPAAGPAGKGGAAVVSRVRQVTVTGVLTKQDVVVADRARVRYLLVTESGVRVRLPAVQAGNRNGMTQVAGKLAEFLNQRVKVVGVGSELKKGGKSQIRFKTVKAVEKVAPAAPAPAAPGPAKVG